MTSNADSIMERARRLGAEHGRNSGSWVIDGNTSAETARAIVAGYEDGDPRVMDMQPSPLSGEWADDMSPSDLMLALDLDPSAIYEDIHEDDICDAYEMGFSEGFWEQVIADARGFGHVA